LSSAINDSRIKGETVTGRFKKTVAEVSDFDDEVWKIKGKRKIGKIECYIRPIQMRMCCTD
jgi:hypothetical protein